MDLSLEGTAAIVTGASRGLGAAMVRALVAEGANVVAAARTTEALEALAAEQPDRIEAVSCDMRDLEAVGALVDSGLERFGRIDTVVNNAGIAPAGKLVDTGLDVMQETLTVNVLAPAALARRAAQHWIQAEQAGSVINIASTVGLRGKPLLSSYSASKGAMMRLTESLAAEWARYDIRVNTIAPGAFKTDAQAAVLNNPATLEARVRKIPARRMAEPDEICPLVAYLASPISKFVTGSCFVIDGGEVSKL